VDKIKWWDEYEIKARFIPVFISMIPLVHFLILFVGLAFWKELISNVGWMLVADIGLSLIIMLALVQAQCGLAKYFIEEPIFGKGGAHFPTTDMLLYKEGLISKTRKELLRNTIRELFDCAFSTEVEEIENPSDARLQAREAVGHVRTYVGRGIMTFRYNIRYGFFRNFTGGVIWGVLGSIGCSALYGLKGEWAIMSLFAAYLIVFLLLFFYRKNILGHLAFTYADSLYNELINKYKGEKVWLPQQ
jgi:hypothetical protein